MGSGSLAADVGEVAWDVADFLVTSLDGAGHAGDWSSPETGLEYALNVASWVPFINATKVGALSLMGGGERVLAGEAAATALGGPQLAARASRVTVCFAAGTQVHTAEGLKSIEDVEVGDLVWSRDDETGEQGLRRVTRTFVTPEQTLLEVAVEAADGEGDQFRTTGEHPFWVRARGWARAAELQVGDELAQLGGGWLRVAGIESGGAQETVYNFEVEGFHTYFVGELGAWVHNTCWDDIAGHVLERGRFAGQTQQQVAQYLKTFAESATPTTVASGARIWRRGAKILIQRPGAGAGGTWFRADSVRAAERRLQKFIVEEGGIAF